MKCKHKKKVLIPARQRTFSAPKPVFQPALAGRASDQWNEAAAVARSRARDCNRLITHIVQTLPDSFPSRAHLLESLTRIVPASHPRHTDLIRVVNHLYQHIIAARDLAANLEEQQ